MSGKDQEHSFNRFSDEPKVIKQARLVLRLTAPEVQVRLNLSIGRMLTNAIDFLEGGKDLAAMYKSLMDLTSIGCFGEDAQQVDLTAPIAFSDKDFQYLGMMSDVQKAMQERNSLRTREALTAIPMPVGSRCDKGEFDGFNHEVLFATAQLAQTLNILVPTSDQDLRANRRIQACGQLVPNVETFLTAMRNSDRSGAFGVLLSVGATTIELIRPKTAIERLKETVGGFIPHKS